MNSISEDPLWYKDGIIYQVHIKAFKDSSGDGIGDFRGLISKLDYLQNLGITILWLLPFYPSPLKDDGYDIADYYNINPDYGTLDDFKFFLDEAHRRGLKVVTELVLNHTSDQHEWFKKARSGLPGSSERDFYVWSDTSEKYKEARIIFQDFEVSNWTWDHKAKSYFWHRFYSHQPDLNFENEKVHEALFNVLDFWLDMGVDGLRLDAVPYLYERDGTNCENLPETHLYLKKVNAYIQHMHKNKMLLAEANQWPEDAVAYFGDGDECQMAFHFPLMPRIYMATQMEERFPIIDILEQTPSIPANCQWALFLRNHDELTLEMVTDEERDYMYRFFARDARARINLGIRRRLAPLIENNRRKIELMNILLFSFPGTPIIYYGDEIGMGDNFYLGDRNGVRTPMQWSPDRNAGFSDANPQRLFLPVIIDPEYNYESVNVEVQQRSPSSLLRWMQRAIAVRKSYSAFGRGSLEFLNPANSKVLVFIRKYEGEVILVVANLSRFSQVVELDLHDYTAYTPIEAFSRNKFPVIKDSPYMLSLSAYDYYWFILKSESKVINAQKRTLPSVDLTENMKELFTGLNKKILEEDILSDYLANSSWFDGEKDKVLEVKVSDQVKISGSNNFIILISVSYVNEMPDNYILPMTVIPVAENKSFFSETPFAVLAELRIGAEYYYLIDGFYNNDFRENLLIAVSESRVINTSGGRIAITKKEALAEGGMTHSTFIVKDQKNDITLRYGEKYFIKIYRKIAEGINPGSEISNQLSGGSGFHDLLPFIGEITYYKNNGESYSAGLINSYLPTQGTAYEYFCDAVKKFFENIRSRFVDKENLPFTNVFSEPELVQQSSAICESIDRINSEMVRTLGRQTGEFHHAIAASGNMHFAPEDFSMLYQRSIYQSGRSLVKTTYRLLRNPAVFIPEKVRPALSYILDHEPDVIAFIEKILKDRLLAMKIRIHGNYHLANILFTGKDFIIHNFEGNPASALSERRLKRSPLRDAASLIYSLHFAVYSMLERENVNTAEERTMLESLAGQWWMCMSSSFIHEYLKTIKSLRLLPEDEKVLEYMLHIYLLEKAFYELKFAVENNKEWIEIPAKMINYILKFIKETTKEP